MGATKPVDFRRGHDGLAATVQRELGLDPHSGVIVVFRAKRADRIKILVWDGSGPDRRALTPTCCCGDGALIGLGGAPSAIARCF